jgi:hypothetical protein
MRRRPSVPSGEVMLARANRSGDLTLSIFSSERSGDLTGVGHSIR